MKLIDTHKLCFDSRRSYESFYPISENTIKNFIFEILVDQEKI